MSDEEIVQSLLDDLNAKRAQIEEDDYNFFFKASADVQKAYYDYWLHSHSEHDALMPRFLIDYEKDLKLS